MEKRCRALCEPWRARLSVAEHLHAARAETAAPTLDTAALERIYDHQYEQHFSRRSHRKRTARNDVVFGRLLSFLLTEEIDATTFIAANMAALREFVRGTRFGFQPSMLSGEKAKARYNAYLRKANRRFKTGGSAAFESRSELGVLRVELAAGETSVGFVFVEHARCGLPCGWEAAADSADPPETWTQVMRRRGPAHYRLLLRLSPEVVERETRLARLEAVSRVLEHYEPGLATRVGFNRLTWEGVRDLVLRLFPLETADVVDVSEVPGLRWGAGV